MTEKEPVMIFGVDVLKKNYTNKQLFANQRKGQLL